MRTLALTIAVSVCLGTTAAQALCTTGVECIRERFGTDRTVRNNRIIDSTDRLGDRGRALNPYLAGQNVAGQARRAGRFDSTLGGRASDGAGTVTLVPGQLRPDSRHSPATSLDPYAAGSVTPGGTPSDRPGASEMTVAPYEPAAPTTGAAGTTRYGTTGSGTGRAAASSRRDPNTPQGATNLGYSGPRSAGALR